MGKKYKGLDAFFGQAPQLAKILYIIIRYNLLTTSFSPTKTLFFIKGAYFSQGFSWVGKAFRGMKISMSIIGLPSVRDGKILHKFNIHH